MPRPTFHNLATEKRERLVRASIAEFAAHPYREASLDRIAAAAGVSKGSLYQYFEDKADLYRHVVMDELGARKAAKLPPPPTGTFFERLEAMFHAGLGEFRSDPQLAALGARLVSDTSQPEVRALTSASLERATTFFRGELREAQARGEVRGELDLDVAARLVATIAGPALVDLLAMRLGKDLATLARGRARIDEQTLRSTVHAVMDVLAHGLGAPSPASHALAPPRARPTDRPPRRKP